MTKLKIDPNLTAGDYDKAASMTHVGQAHFAGTGPKGTRCVGCAHWLFVQDWVMNKWGSGDPKPSPCAKFMELARVEVKKAAKVPHNAASCRYFEPRDEPIPLRRPGA
jgi:hypothetical protein